MIDLILLGITVFLLFSMLDFRRKLTFSYSKNKKIESSLMEYKKLHAEHLLEKANSYGNQETFVFSNKISLKKREILNILDNISENNLISLNNFQDALKKIES